VIAKTKTVAKIGCDCDCKKAVAKKQVKSAIAKNQFKKKLQP
jgi:hypothetical protein